MQNESDGESFRTGGAFDALADATNQFEASLIGRELGDYRITRLIAEGGMSRVFAAERIDGGFEREVAIKISPVGGFNSATRQHFSLEQGVLAGLNHPNIAQLYDARLTREGWPYIVMELVDGGPIDDFCQARNLSIRDRVRMLCDVCDAVSYAHARLVVHRDIKPSNILVSAEGRPKLLDFGIAKLLEGDDGELTRAGLMTPRYASPEQLLGKPITVASDIYQLGLLIWEVTTGQALTREEPLSDSIQRAAEGTEFQLPALETDRMPRDLALIIERALRPDPVERYNSVDALQSDLEAFLKGYPVRAAGRRVTYRLRKFVMRNLTATLVSAVAAVTILGGSAWYAVNLAEARDLAERRAATSNRVLQAMSNLIADTFSGLITMNAERQAGDESYIESVLKETVELIERELAGEPGARAELLRVQGTIETALGNVAAASVALESAYDLVDPAGTPLIALSILLDRVEVAVHGLDIAEARRMVDEAGTLIANGQPDSELEGYYYHQLGQVLMFEGKYEAAIAEFQRAIEILEATRPVNSRLLAATFEELAYTYSAWNRNEKAIVAANRAIEILSSTESAMSPRLIHPLRYSGWASMMLDDNDTARRQFERALRIATSAFGDIHPDISAVQASMGALAYREGRLRDAAAHFEEEMRIVEAMEGPDGQNLVTPQVNLAGVYLHLGELDQAAKYARSVLDATSDGSPASQPYRYHVLIHEGRRRAAVGDVRGAVAAAREIVDLAKGLFGDDSPVTFDRQAELAAMLARSGRIDEAQSTFQTNLEALARSADTDANEVGSMALRSWVIDFEEGDVRSARRKLGELIARERESGKLAGIESAALFAAYSVMSLKLGDIDSARQALEEARLMARNAPEHPVSLELDVIGAEIAFATGDAATAGELAQRVLGTLEARYPLRSDLIQRASELLK